MTILENLYASGGTEIRVPCLSFRCEDWEAIHICQGWDDLTATLETAEEVAFTASDFSAQLAKKSKDGNQALQFAIDASQSDALEKLDAALESGNKVYIDYREFLLSDLSAPARNVETMTVTGYSYEYPNLLFTASFHDLVNKAWPRIRYNTTIAKGLKYYGT